MYIYSTVCMYVCMHIRTYIQYTCSCFIRLQCPLKQQAWCTNLQHIVRMYVCMYVCTYAYELDFWITI